MTDSITVLKHFYWLMTPEEKTSLMHRLEINSRNTLGRYIKDPYSLKIRQGLEVTAYILEQFQVEVTLEGLGRDLHSLMKNSDEEQRKRITHRMAGYYPHQA